MQNKDLMTTGPIKEKIVKFALPLMAGNLFQNLYNAADSVIVGNFIGSNALAAVSSAGNLIFMVVGFFVGLSAGCGVVIGRYIGAQDKKNTGIAVHTTLAIGIINSIIMTLIGILYAKPVLTLMGTPDDVLVEAVHYFQVYFAGSFGFVMYNTLISILQAAGDSKRPLQYLIVSSIINIVLDLVLIAGLHMDVRAAAFATAVSQLFSAILCVRRLLKIDADYRIEFSKIRLNRSMAAQTMHMGIPSGLQNTIMGFSNVVIQSYINSYGAMAMAGIGAYCKVEGFIFIPITAFAVGITTFTSQNYGAGNYDRIRKGARFGILSAVIMAEIMGAVLFLSAPYLIAMFDRNPEVIAFGVARARYVTPFFFLCAFTHAMSAVMRGLGKPMVPLFVFLFCWCAMRIIILAVTELFVHTVMTTYLVYPITWTLSSTVLLCVYLFKVRRQLVQTA